jgi:hypothetical protein
MLGESFAVESEAAPLSLFVYAFIVAEVELGNPR